MTGTAPDANIANYEPAALVRQADTGQLSFPIIVSKGGDPILPLAHRTAGDAVPGAFGSLLLVADAQEKPPVGDAAAKQGPGDAAPKPAKEVQPPRLDHFNANVTPADHFRWFMNDQVSASGRVHVGTDKDTAAGREGDGETNLLGLVEMMHPSLKQQLDAGAATAQTRDQVLHGAAHSTAIVELRTMGDAKLTGTVLKSNDDEMTAEEQAAKALGIDHVNFPMNSHDLQPPTFIA